DGELLQFLSPLGWEHINLTGDYVWRQSRRLEDGKFRPLRMPGVGGQNSWELGGVEMEFLRII
ncbi:hypothetical protein MX600_23150, partial [Escherichia coli]|nr:hypothetical protein [Escherichia coli]